MSGIAGMTVVPMPGAYNPYGVGPSGQAANATSMIGAISPDMAVGEASHVSGTVVPGYVGSAFDTSPVLEQVVFPQGATSATINYGSVISPSALEGVISALTVLPQMFYSGFVNALLNDDLAKGAGQVAISVAPAALGGLLSGIANVLPSTTGSSLIPGATPVLGGLNFTTPYIGQPGYNVLPTSVNYTWGATNLPWLNQMIATGQSFLVGPGGSVTQQEVGALIAAGYSSIGRFLVPPLP